MTPGTAAAFWQELQRAVSLVGVLRQPPAWRRRRTGEMRVTITERRAMQAFHLMTGASYIALARRFRRDRHYMPKWIWTAEYRAFFEYYWSIDGSTYLTKRSRKAAGENASCTAA